MLRPYFYLTNAESIPVDTNMWSNRPATAALAFSQYDAASKTDKNRLPKNCPSSRQFVDFFESKVATARKAAVGDSVVRKTFYLFSGHSLD